MSQDAACQDYRQVEQEKTKHSIFTTSLSGQTEYLPHITESDVLTLLLFVLRDGIMQQRSEASTKVERIHLLLWSVAMAVIESG